MDIQIKKTIINFQKQAKRYNKIVVWGQRSKNADSFRYIMDHYYSTLQKLGTPSIWVDDKIGNHGAVTKGDLVIAADVTGRNLPKVSGACYCLHNFSRDYYENFDANKVLTLQVYSNDAVDGTVAWDAVTRFDKKKKTLYQPWGTNLLPWEFMLPVYSKYSPVVFWVGSVWDNEKHQGNLEVIKELKKVLKKHSLFFLQTRQPDKISIPLIRASRLAPAFAGLWQAKVNYMPCRVFKNISYGQLAMTNVLKFKDLLGSTFVEGGSVEQIVENVLSLSEDEYKQIIIDQQQAISKQTYMHKLLNIFRGLEEIR